MHKTIVSYRKNWEQKPERNSGDSSTVPNQVMSIESLLVRHLGHANVNVAAKHDMSIYTGMKPVFDPDGTKPDPRTLDLVDVDEMKREAANTMQAVQTNVTNELEAKAEERKAKQQKAQKQAKNEPEPPSGE